MNDKNKVRVGRGIRYGFVSFLIIFSMVMVLVVQPEIEITKEWSLAFSFGDPARADANPGVGAGGVLRVYVVKNNTFNYNNNITITGDVYAYGDSNNSHIGTDVPHSQAIDVVVEVRFNESQAYDTGTASWRMDWIRANANCSGLSVSSYDCIEYQIDTVGDENGGFVWVNYVIPNKSITEGQNVTSCMWHFEAYMEP